MKAYKKANKDVQAIVIDKLNHYKLESEKIVKAYKALTMDYSLLEKLKSHLRDK